MSCIYFFSNYSVLIEVRSERDLIKFQLEYSNKVETQLNYRFKNTLDYLKGQEEYLFPLMILSTYRSL